MAAIAESRRAHLLTVARLLRSQAHRSRNWFWLGFAPGFANQVGDHPELITWFMAGSMAIAFLMGVMSGDEIGCREHRVLPVTDRDLWVTRWLHATVAVPAGLLIFKLVAFVWHWGFHPNDSPLMTVEVLVISTVFDVVFASAMMPVPHLSEQWSNLLVHRRRVGSSLVALALTLAPFGFGFGLPILLARSLPSEFSEFSRLNASVLMVGIGLAIAAWAWTPKRGGDRLLFRDIQKPQTVLPVYKPRFGDRFTGIQGIGWSHLKTTFVAAVVAYGIAVISARWFPDPAGSDPRFATALFLVFAMMAVTMSSGVWSMWVRHLKVLPISIGQVNCLLVLTPLATWTVITLVPLSVHAVMGWPIREELTPHAALMYSGFTSLTHAMGFRFSGSRPGGSISLMVGVTGAVATAIAFFGRPDVSTRLVVLTIAVSCFLVAALINYYTFTRSTSSARPYRRPGVA